MTPEVLLPVLATAFVTGLLGSAHCFGMCGGIAGSLGALAGAPQPGRALQSAMLFNGGRVISTTRKR